MDSTRKLAEFWSYPAQDLMGEFESSPNGLSGETARIRLQKIGPNSVEDQIKRTALALLLRQFESPLVLILIFGAVVAMALQEWLNASIILAIVAGSTLLGFFQEYRASKAVEALKRRLALTCRVLRDGIETAVPAGSIAPGDVVLLSAGNLVPADAIVLAATDFLVTEASLTGESFPVEKRPGVLPRETALGRRTNTVFLGSSVRSGSARVLAVATGRQTAFGAIAARLKRRAPETEFERGVRQFGNMLVRAMFLIVLFVLTVNQLLGRPFIDSLLFAVALSVGLSPELLPAIVSVTLSAGARELARRGVIVRRLEAIENLGSMDILCTDKTGTLTEGIVALDDAAGPDGRRSARVRELAFLNASFETGIENPLDAAIVATGKREGMTAAGYRKIDEIPYDFLRKRLTIVVEDSADPAQHLMIAKGAFANVLSICTALEQNGGEVPMGEKSRNELENFFERKGEAGFRVLAVATRRIAAREHYHHEDEAGLTFAGFLLFFDPPKPDARQTINALAALGIGIKIVSGDNRFVTRHLADAIGLDSTSLVTGEDISAMKDEALWHMVEKTTLFVEIDPQQKERIVRALQHMGHAVGYLGDGINDAPALHTADVGISVDQAVDVARESADVILLQRDLNVLRQGITDGRRIFANTLKYISITTSANFGNMVSMALATPLLPFFPLAATQILLNNFLSDIPSMAISTDNVDPERIQSAQRWNVRDVQRFMVVFGLTSSIFDLLTFAILLFVFSADEITFQTVWFIVSLLTELAVVMVLRTQRPALRSRPGRVLLWTTASMGIFCLAVPFLGPAAAAFGFLPISADLLIAAIVIAGSYLVATEIMKRWFYKQPIILK